MTMHDCMLYAGIRSSRKFARLTWFQRDFFYGLLHAAWPAGRFESDVEVLRAAVYAPLLPKVTKRDVQDALVKCHEVGLVKLWTDDSGRGWGEVTNYRQTGLRKRKPADDGSPPLPPAPESEPDLFRPAEKEGKKEGEGAQNARRKAPTPPRPFSEKLSTAETQEQWLARLTAEWPEVHLPKQLTLAETAQRLQGKDLERDWFEARWLPKTSAVVRLGGGALASALPAEPEGWRVYLKDEYEGESWAESAAACTWASLPGNWRERLLREYQGRRSA